MVHIIILVHIIISPSIQIAGVVSVAQQCQGWYLCSLLIFPQVHNVSADVPAIISAFKTGRSRNLEVLTSCLCPSLSRKKKFLRFPSSRSLLTSGARG